MRCRTIEGLFHVVGFYDCFTVGQLSPCRVTVNNSAPEKKRFVHTAFKQQLSKLQQPGNSISRILFPRKQSVGDKLCLPDAGLKSSTMDQFHPLHNPLGLLITVEILHHL